MGASGVDSVGVGGPGVERVGRSGSTVGADGSIKNEVGSPVGSPTVIAPVTPTADGDGGSCV